MDKSNPTLYGKLQAFKENSAAGLDAFVQAQSVSIPPPLTKTFYENNADSKSDYFHSEESSTLKATSSASSELWDPDEIESEFYNPFTEGLGYFLLKFPFLILVCAIISIELLFYFTVRQSVAVWEYAFVWRGKLGSFRRQLRTAQSYEGWKNVAKELDTYIGNDKWRKQPSKAYYDHKLISDLLEKMSGFRKTGQMEKLMEVLLQAGLRNNVVTVSLDYIGSSPNLKSSEKKRFFKAAFRNYGRSALCLSGGATLAYFHFGVVRTLLDNNMLPKIITGTSAGSMIAAMIACRSDSELRELLNPDMYLVVNACEGSFVEKLQYLIANGKLFEARKFAEKSQWVTKGHTTFLEAYRMTGKILNITAVPYNSYGPTKFLNYLTTPNVVIWSAVMASSSVPCVLEPITLMIKMEDGTLEPYLGAGVKWRDGSIKTDIPIESLNAQFNVKYTIVSQANPHVAIFYYENRGGVGSPAAHRNGRGWRGGFMASSLEHYLKLDLKKWLRVLRDLELLPFIMKQDLSNVWLQKFDGNATIFPSFSLYNYLHMLDDPTLERMEGYFRSGTIKTWPKLHKIHNHTRIEHSIFYWLKILYNTKEDYDIPQNAHILPNGKPDDEYTTLSTDSGIGTEVQYLNPEDLHNNLLDFVMGICGEELSIKH